jgi:hypothetical protein
VNPELDAMLPECAGCRRPMMLSRIELVAGRTGIERRTFECRWCPRTESYVCELQKRSLLDPFAPRTPPG